MEMEWYMRIKLKKKRNKFVNNEEYEKYNWSLIPRKNNNTLNWYEVFVKENGIPRVRVTRLHNVWPCARGSHAKYTNHTSNSTCPS